MSVILYYTLPGARLADLVLDATISEQHSSKGEITDFPVETGTDITDHKRIMPDKLRIEGVVSNSPLPSQTNAPSTFADDMHNGVYSGRAESAYAQLLEIHRSGVAISITTLLRQYDNMELESLEVPRSAVVGDVVRFTADFKQVTTVTSQTVSIPTKASKPPKKHMGDQPKKAVGGAGRGKTTAAAIADGVPSSTVNAVTGFFQ